MVSAEYFGVFIFNFALISQVRGVIELYIS